jgi:hypothetical protein
MGYETSRGSMTWLWWWSNSVLAGMFERGKMVFDVGDLAVLLQRCRGLKIVICI